MEQVLPPFMSCNLSAINISKFVKKDGFAWDGLYTTTYNIMGLMDNLIDKMDFPDERFKVNTRNYRPVGIGPMGMADAMFMLGKRYDATDGKKFAGEVMKTMTKACIHRSCDLAKEKGTFHDYDIFKEDVERILAEHCDGDERIMKMVRENGVRNCQFTTAQPTGTTALSCDCSYGIEPSFGLVFQKNLIDKTKMIVTNPIFENKYKDEDWYTDNLPERIFKNGGSLKGLRGIPKEVREVFVVAHDIKYRDRIDMQSELQKYCSTSISSTVNLPKETTKEEISDIYKYAYDKGLKGVTVYRDGCKLNQPVSFKEDVIVTASSIYKRPSKLTSNTYVLETGSGKMYVTICDCNNRPVEVFIHLGKSGQVMNTFCEALGRLLSISLQNGVSIDEITKTLIGINSDSATWYRFEENDKKPTQILSIPDGIAQLLNRYYSGESFKIEQTGKICDKCGAVMNATEGCWTCPSCPNSKCS